MNHNFNIKALSEENIPEIECLFLDVFTHDPWNDDWSNKDQLRNYLIDIISNKNSLTLGLYNNDKIKGLSLGNIIHWCSGTEYYIREFFINREDQNKGFGSIFINQIQDYLIGNGIKAMILSTEIGTPAYDFYIKNDFKELEKTRFFYKSLSANKD